MKKKKINIVPYLFIAPTFILVFIFSYYAMGDALVLSFMDAKVGFDYSFNSFGNYIRLFQDVTFWQSFGNQGIMTLMSVFNSVFWPLLAAELLFFIRRKKIANIVKTAFVIPMLVAGHRYHSDLAVFV